jgi:putative tricarboxylic transport membrane protein
MASITKKNAGEIGITIALGIIALTFYLLATFKQTVNPMDPGPSLFPRLLSVLLLLLCVGQLAVSFRKKPQPKTENDAESSLPNKVVLLYVFGALALTIVYVYVFTDIVYPVTTAIYLFALMYLLGIRKWHVLILVSTLYTAITFYLYGEVLMIPLP